MMRRPEVRVPVRGLAKEEPGRCPEVSPWWRYQHPLRYGSGAGRERRQAQCLFQGHLDPSSSPSRAAQRLLPPPTRQQGLRSGEIK